MEESVLPAMLDAPAKTVRWWAWWLCFRDCSSDTWSLNSGRRSQSMYVTNKEAAAAALPSIHVLMIVQPAHMRCESIHRHESMSELGRLYCVMLYRLLFTGRVIA